MLMRLYNKLFTINWVSLCILYVKTQLVFHCCFLEEKSKTEMKIKLDCASDGSVKLANSFLEQNKNNMALTLEYSK